MEVAVLGAGPAGLLVAHACFISGVRFKVISEIKKSGIGGAQFLHRAIPDLTEKTPDGEVLFKHLGSDEGYAQRVYGDRDAPTSWGEYASGSHEVWNLKAAYEELWIRYGGGIIDTKLSWASPYDLEDEFDMILVCVPAPVFCSHDNCQFTSQEVWITEGATCSNMEIVYNGTPDSFHNPEWYRQSNIFGHGSQEWAFDPRTMNQVKIKKPLTNNCPGPDLFVPWIPLGRYGQWKKGQLTHHAFEGAMDALQQMQ